MKIRYNYREMILNVANVSKIMLNFFVSNSQMGDVEMIKFVQM